MKTRSLILANHPSSRKTLAATVVLSHPTEDLDGRREYVRTSNIEDVIIQTTDGRRATIDDIRQGVLVEVITARGNKLPGAFTPVSV